MTEKDAAQQRAILTRKLSPHSMPGDRGSSRGSYETGESSATGSLLNDTTLLPSPDESSGARRPLASSPKDAEHTNGYHGGRADARKQQQQRATRHRSNGAFLLQDAFRNDGDSEEEEQVPRLRHVTRNIPPSRRTKDSERASDRSGSSAGRDAGYGLAGLESPPRRNGDSSPPQPMNRLTVRKRDAPNGSRPLSGTSFAPPANAPLDIDSAQIVNMALNLSESRRQVSRRIAPPQAVPTLAQLPDGTTGANLKNHLQQQRRMSRTRSPGPEKALTPRLPSTGMLSSPLQATFDMSREGTFRNHFTASTLARVQKAKEHLELMAQYRRLLELVPPIQSHNQSRPTTASPPTSSGGVARIPTYGSADGSVRLGRPYNPLQYIRNRKVRARERKAIDGEAQGFGDFIKVADWVDEVAKWAATGQTSTDGCTLPPFTDADVVEQQNALQATTSANKPRRPRLDWSIDAADLLADVYWLEQDHHKQLIEDRHWRRIFPQNVELHRPLSRQNEEYGSESGQTPGRKEYEGIGAMIDPKSSNPGLAKSDTEHSTSSARERARQKLHDLTGHHHHHHHRHSNSVHSHYDWKNGKTSVSDLSESENEGKLRKERRNRAGTLTSSHQDILEKQMLEMIAMEARENGPKKPDGSGYVTPERNAGVTSHPQSRQHSRKASIVEASESDERKSKEKPRFTPLHLQRGMGRSSLEIPVPARRSSFEVDSSLPNSPDGAIRGDPFIPALGGDLSPGSSRANSPTRNPFSKVKQIFRERSKERGSRISEERSSAEDLASAPKTPFEVSPESSGDRKSMDRRGSSRSPSRKVVQRPTGESHKSHRSTASTKLRSDDPGMRGLFKGARIDNVIRGGVSKLGDLIWRKESETGDGPSEAEGTTTDESDTEQRGRKRGETPLSRTASIRSQGMRQQNGKNYLDIMPAFESSHEKLRHIESEPAKLPDTSPPSASHKSPRFDRLKPPRIDILSASPTSSPGSTKRLSDVSEGEPLSGSHSAGLKEADKRLNNIIAVPPSFPPDGRPGSSSNRSRHWSISDHSPAPDRAPMSKREVARLRALVLSSGIKAMEITRRANEPHLAFAARQAPSQNDLQVANVFWPTIAELSPDPASIRNKAVPQTELYQFAAKTLGKSIQCAGQDWQKTADHFVADAVPALHRRVEDVRRRVATDLSAMTRAAADEADETSRDLTLGQRLKIKHTLDVIEAMLRRRRRRFRWVRRAMWLAVEWVLVGFMWYVWFVVMILRVFWGVGQGAVGAVRWLLWL
ncbi:uncharacterized protein CCOS01_06605 [Colletotrichum costaricense]|uniref:Uncharacterized protein n=1 Tax=Colletotrichum costaricense TaxID=1209916 RepID=A0AAI9YZS5_9PEZI|nr:uncharacterized protein CCOS01_06605 [Colletotrichum costaricense]KAK1528771.1 hypothetical protein CCOS01_06605 [Colletotrichum costaricense]